MDVYVARQAVFDRTLSVVAYELLYRPARGAEASGRDDIQATLEVVASSFFAIGLDRMLDGRKALLNVPGNMLTSPALRALPPDLVILEILETSRPGREEVQAILELKQRGFQIAIDDYSGQPELDVLVPLADWIKVDMRVATPMTVRRLMQRFAFSRKILLAEKLESRAEHDQAQRAGFHYFQGYFLERPSTFAGRHVPADGLRRLQLLRLMTAPELDIAEIGEHIEHDVALCVNLVRYANAARFARHSEVTSVQQCLVQLGEIEIRRWIALAVLPQLAEDQPRDLLESALVRARMCELLARGSGNVELEHSAFLCGMFSLLDAILQRPMNAVVEELSLPLRLRSALTGEECPGDPLRRLLAVTTSYEHGDWKAVGESLQALKLPDSALPECYRDSLTWMQQMR